MKLYTDIKQSRKLMKILPRRSADMHYERLYFEGKQSDWFIRIGTPIISDDIIPCWSLATLCESIPEIIHFDNDESDYTFDMFRSGGLYYLSYGNPLEKCKIEIKPQKNFIDACYEMVLKLHELKML